MLFSRDDGSRVQSTLSSSRGPIILYLQKAAHPVVQSLEVSRGQLGEELLPQKRLCDLSFIEENFLGDSAQQPA